MYLTASLTALPFCEDAPSCSSNSALVEEVFFHLQIPVCTEETLRCTRV
jgi:hypothetical protein